jgi:hypothetical protein
MDPESDDESSELLNALLTEIQVELKKEALTGSLGFEFPLEVAEILEPLGDLTWTRVQKSLAAQAIDRLLSDVIDLIEKEDLFAWPLDDPERCLAIVVFHKYVKRVRKKFGVVDENEEDQNPDPADWRETQ